MVVFFFDRFDESFLLLLQLLQFGVFVLGDVHSVPKRIDQSRRQRRKQRRLTARHRKRHLNLQVRIDQYNVSSKFKKLFYLLPWYGINTLDCSYRVSWETFLLTTVIYDHKKKSTVVIQFNSYWRNFKTLVLYESTKFVYFIPMFKNES